MGITGTRESLFQIHYDHLSALDYVYPDVLSISPGIGVGGRSRMKLPNGDPIHQVVSRLPTLPEP